MTLYVGEEFRITASGTDFDGTELTEANVLAVTIKMYDAEQTLMFEDAMDWDADESIWVYLWDTTGEAAGSFRYQVIFTGADGKFSWEWKRVRLARNPITV